MSNPKWSRKASLAWGRWLRIQVFRNLILALSVNIVAILGGELNVIFPTNKAFAAQGNALDRLVSLAGTAEAQVDLTHFQNPNGNGSPDACSRFVPDKRPDSVVLRIRTAGANAVTRCF
jgi:hypothetical protein